MGRYISGPTHGKADHIIRTMHGERLDTPPVSFDAIPLGKALIAVVDNGPFEAAGYVYSPGEFSAFVTHMDRPCVYLLVDVGAVEAAAGG